jgi:hypothetical protein
MHSRRRPGETPQAAGRRFERFWASLFGVTPVKGSGALWYAKLDVGDGSILWSCKHTDAASFSITRELLREAQAAVTGPGGVGGETIPGIAVAIDGGADVTVTLRAEDFLRLLATSARAYIEPSRAEQKRARSQQPGLLRDEVDE